EGACAEHDGVVDAHQAETKPRPRNASIVVLIAVAVLGVAVGFVESAFGPYLALLIGVVVAGLGAAVRRWDAAWSTLLMVFGAAMCAGALAYIAVGLLRLSAPPRGGRSA